MLLKKNDIYLFIIYLCLSWVSIAVRAFSLVWRAGAALVEVGRLLIAEASRCRVWVLGAWASVVVAPGLEGPGSVVVVPGLSCFSTCGMFLDQGLNPCPLHWQVDSLPLHHPGSPRCKLLIPTF